MARPLSHDIDAYVLDWRARPWPLPFEEVFGRVAPLVLEIGFGNGEFLADLAQARPDRDHLGIELSWSGAVRLFPRLAKRSVGNARAILADANVAVERLFAPGSLEEVYVNHPCPWPKVRHHPRRLLRRDFLELLATRMRPGAHLTLVTDHAEYAAWLHEELAAQSAFESRHATAEVAAIEGRKPTKYQQKAMDQGVPIHFFEWRRPAQAAADERCSVPAARLAPPPTDPLESPMLSVTLEGHLEPDQALAAFVPRSTKTVESGITIIVKLETAYRATDGTWLVACMTQEDALRQDFALMVVPQPAGRVLVKLGELGRPHPTFAVKRAVHLLATAVLERCPGARVLHQNLGSDVVEGASC